YVARRCEDRLHAFRDGVEQARVFGAAMIDERLGHRGQHWLGNGHGSRDEQQAPSHRKGFPAGRGVVSVQPPKRKHIAAPPGGRRTAGFRSRRRGSVSALGEKRKSSPGVLLPPSV